MFKIKIITYCGLLTICFFMTQSCKSKPIYEDRMPIENIKVRSQDIDSGFKASSLIKDYEFIPLEQTPKSIIGEIDKLVEFRDQLYVVDRFNANAVFVFTKNGNFLWRLGSLGKDPGQYVYPHDIFIDSIRGIVKVLDSENRRINDYRVDNGAFVSSSTLAFPCRRMSQTKSYRYLIGSNQSLIAASMDETKVLANFFSLRHGLARLPHQSFLNVNDTLTLFQINYLDTIYRIDNDKIYPYRAINYGDFGVKENDISGFSPVADITKELPNKRITYRYYFESESHVFFTFIQNKRLFAVIYSKGDKKVRAFPYDAVDNDRTFEDHFPIVTATNKSGQFISVVNGNTMRNRINNSRNVPTDDSLKSKIDRLQSKVDFDKTINPVLMFFKFK